MTAQTLLKELFADPLQKAIPEWIWQRWPHEVLQFLSSIDSERVRDAAHTFRKRTSCADDHLVIEMLRELDEDMWETLAKCFEFRLLNHRTEDQDKLWARQLATMVKKKNGKLTMRGFRSIAMLPTMYRLHSKVLQQLAGQAIHPGTARNMAMSLVDKPMKWSSSCAEWLSKRTNGGYQSSRRTVTLQQHSIMSLTT